MVATLYAQNPEQAGSTWLALHFVKDGLGGGNEIVGGIWVLLLSLAALRSAQLPKFLNYLGLMVSTAGIMTMIPVFGELGGSIFGLIVWFIWLGIAMMRSKVSAHQEHLLASHA